MDPSSRVNEQVDFFWERAGYFPDHIAAKKIHERVAPRCAEDETRDAEVYFIEANLNPILAEDEDFALSAGNAGLPYP